MRLKYVQNIINCLNIAGLRLTDHNTPIIVSEHTYNPLQNIDISHVSEAVNLSYNAYHFTISQEHLSEHYPNIKSLIGTPIEYIKYDTTRQKAIMRHKSVIAAATVYGDETKVEVASMFKKLEASRHRYYNYSKFS